MCCACCGYVWKAIRSLGEIPLQPVTHERMYVDRLRGQPCAFVQSLFSVSVGRVKLASVLHLFWRCGAVQGNNWVESGAERKPLRISRQGGEVMMLQRSLNHWLFEMCPARQGKPLDAGQLARKLFGLKIQAPEPGCFCVERGSVGGATTSGGAIETARRVASGWRLQVRESYSPWGQPIRKVRDRLWGMSARSAIRGCQLLEDGGNLASSIWHRPCSAPPT